MKPYDIHIETLIRPFCCALRAYNLYLSFLLFSFFECKVFSNPRNVCVVQPISIFHRYVATRIYFGVGHLENEAFLSTSQTPTCISVMQFILFMQSSRYLPSLVAYYFFMTNNFHANCSITNVLKRSYSKQRRRHGGLNPESFFSAL
jgi:hypothetical protein